ncbi:hypothetical protein FHX37_2048 [Haloactinospora alba]|uniref:Uncharacterized protein n=1 Tax=Haloactinospora alba TaxID=405555 RepID=A0A543NK18_9ACTN|nr:hypothetical protein [Haloactinospora alba]TQN32120.1 hypothetical protein FHX37_2048 [Haloactinospora alba]
MSALINIAVFGVVGAVMMAALIGLLLATTARRSGAWVASVFSTVSVVLLIAVPALAVVNVRATVTGTGLGQAWLVAFAVVAIVYAANLFLLPLVRRRFAAVRDDRGARELRVSWSMLAGGVVLCALLAVCATAVAFPFT